MPKKNKTTKRRYNKTKRRYNKTKRRYSKTKRRYSKTKRRYNKTKRIINSNKYFMKGGAPNVDVPPVEPRFPPGEIFMLDCTEDEEHNGQNEIKIDAKQAEIDAKQAEIEAKQAEIKAKRLNFSIMQKVIQMKKSLRIKYEGNVIVAGNAERMIDGAWSRGGTTKYKYSFTISRNEIVREIPIEGTEKNFRELSDKFPTIFFNRYERFIPKERRNHRLQLIGSWLAELILNYIVRVTIIRDEENVFYLLFGVDSPTELDSSRGLEITSDDINKLLKDIGKGMEKLLRDINKDIDQLSQEMQQERHN
tara:strand:+ start:789 stop:1706 length:918 start_codon:yes stop_codon:yes gene_type:complete